MKVKKVMKTGVGFCSLEDNLTEAAKVMWQKDCGVVPVVDEKSKVVGMITDRDICIAVASREQRASEIKTKELVDGKKVISCLESDSLDTVLKKMKSKAIKRLPVVGKNNELLGIISITDLLLLGKKDKDIRKKVYSTLKAIGKPRRIVLKEISKFEM